MEILVASGLFLLVLALAFGYLIPASKSAYKMQIRSHLQQATIMALDKIRASASLTSVGGFSIAAQPSTVVAFNPAEDIQAANGLLTWAPFYDVYWLDPSDHTLRQRRWPPGDPVSEEGETSIVRAKRLDPARLLLIADSAQPNRILARDVSLFEVAHHGTDAVVQPIEITLEITPQDSTIPKIRQSISLHLESRL